MWTFQFVGKGKTHYLELAGERDEDSRKVEYFNDGPMARWLLFLLNILWRGGWEVAERFETCQRRWWGLRTCLKYTARVDWNWMSDGASSYFEFANSLRVLCQLRGLMVELKELTVQRAQLYLMSSIQHGHVQRNTCWTAKQDCESFQSIFKGMKGKKDGCVLLHAVYIGIFLIAL